MLAYLFLREVQGVTAGAAAADELVLCFEKGFECEKTAGSWNIYSMVPLNNKQVTLLAFYKKVCISNGKMEKTIITVTPRIT